MPDVAEGYLQDHRAEVMDINECILASIKIHVMPVAGMGNRRGTVVDIFHTFSHSARLECPDTSGVKTLAGLAVSFTTDFGTEEKIYEVPNLDVCHMLGLPSAFDDGEGPGVVFEGQGVPASDESSECGFDFQREGINLAEGSGAMVTPDGSPRSAEEEEMPTPPPLRLPRPEDLALALPGETFQDGCDLGDPFGPELDGEDFGGLPHPLPLSMPPSPAPDSDIPDQPMLPVPVVFAAGAGSDSGIGVAQAEDIPVY